MPETENIRSLTIAVDRLADKVEGEKQARRLGVVVGIFAVVLLAVGLVLIFRDAQQEKDSRAEARVTSCEQYNIGVVKQVNDLLTGIAEDVGYPVAELGFLLPERDCSPEGIAAFFDDSDETNPYKEKP